MKDADRHGFFFFPLPKLFAYTMHKETVNGLSAFFFLIIIFHISSSVAIKMRVIFVVILGFQSTFIWLWAFFVFCFDTVEPC